MYLGLYFRSEVAFFFSFSSAILASASFSATFIFLASSSSEAISSVRYSLTIFHPALERSAILISLFLFTNLLIAFFSFLFDDRPFADTSSSSANTDSLNSNWSLLEGNLKVVSLFLFFCWVISFTFRSIISSSIRFL